MTTHSVVVFLVLLLLTGCSAPRQVSAPDPHNELILLTPLPTLTSFATAFGTRLSAVFHVSPDGTVMDVSLIRSSGDPEWDRVAMDSLRQWRFAPIAGSEKPADRWIRYGIVVQIQEPVLMQLAEMIIPTQRKADSLYALLKEGADFESLARKALTGGAEGSWRPAECANLARYPDQVRAAVIKLHSDQVSEPLRLGTNYVIFKRCSLQE